jgi:hypothetical protein
MTLSSFQRLPGGSKSGDNSDGEYKSSLRRRLEMGAYPATPPKPKPFDMSDPFQQPGGLWSFWLTADDPLLKFAAHLSCIMPLSTPAFSRPMRGRVMLGINPRYDHEEAWLWVYSQLEAEAQNVELSPAWDAVFQDEEEG